MNERLFSFTCFRMPMIGQWGLNELSSQPAMDSGHYPHPSDQLLIQTSVER